MDGFARDGGTASEPSYLHMAFASAADVRRIEDEDRHARWLDLESRRMRAERERAALIRELREMRLTEADIERGYRRFLEAVRHGAHEHMLIRFPNELCTDGGRAVNAAEPDWPDTLTGVPRQLYELWRDRLRGLGYGVRAMILEFPGGMPGDVGLFLTWD